MKSKIKYFVLMLTLLLMPITSLLADNYSYRGKEMNVVYIIGMALLIIRIIVPILLIIMGMIGLVKAMTQSDDREIKKEISSLILKVVAAIIIFILPTIVALLMKLVNQSSSWAEYSKCVSKPSTCNVTLWDN